MYLKLRIEFSASNLAVACHNVTQENKLLSFFLFTDMVTQTIKRFIPLELIR